ncbi:HAD-IA family hydrolase [Herbivorax sp. ANBcel31]|uniref:HAD-IA family hydrolase n=1 Tax=Herbivorax sp. ANBcel31 TaxID=3069754 RepID=UPI0027B46E1F|nr:HAD-IA family hydrolase [Herbivorax sp. ANBcel31]MDQ2086477.1 HAD-IA family hydrolase [Herbivorax sp. ANBcel31]
MQKTLVFDFDGTIVNSIDAAVQMYNELAQEHNYKKITSRDFSALSKMSIVKKCDFLLVPKLKIPFLYHEAKKKFKHFFSNVNAFEDMKEVISILKSENYNLNIISSNSEDTIKEVLKRNEIDEFNSIHSSKNLFGKHLTINAFIKKNNLKKEDVIYIGDEQRDITACKKSGVSIIAVTWGYDSKELLENNKPDYLANTPKELISIIHKVNSNIRDL